MNNRNIIDSLMDIFTRAIENIVIICIGSTALILIANVFGRYVFQKSIMGVEEVALLLLVWVTFLGACLQIRRRNMVAITFLIEKFPPLLYRGMQIFIQICILLLSAWFIYISYKWFMSPSVIKSTTTTLKIPLWIPYAIFPSSMFIMIVFTFDNIRYFMKHDSTNYQ